MGSKETVREYRDPIALAECECFYNENKDGLALIEAMALCSMNEWPFPDWIENALKDAALSFYKNVFSNVRIEEVGNASSGIVNIIKNTTDYQDESLTDRLEKAKSLFLKQICLMHDRNNLIDIHKRTVRDRAIVDLIVKFSNYIPGERPRFKGSYKAIEKLADILDPLTYEVWKKALNRKDDVLGHVNGNPVRAKDILPECLGATDEEMKGLWKKHKASMIAEEEQYRRL